MSLRHLFRLPMPVNKILECKDCQIYSKMLRKICKKEIYSQFHQSYKKLSFDQRFLNAYG